MVKILRYGSVQKMRNRCRRSTQNNGIFNQFFDIFLFGCFKQKLYALPIHFLLQFTEFQIMTDTNYQNYRPIYYHPPQSESNVFTPSNSYIRHHQQQLTPQTSRISNIEVSNTQYVPKIIESGYIVGPPIAYTQNPNLPNNFQPFSPVKNSMPIMFDQMNRSQRDISPSKIVINQPHQVHPTLISSQIRQTSMSQPSVVVHPPQRYEQTVSRVDYERCLTDCKNWETKYNELYLRYRNLSSNQGADEEIKEQNRRLRQKVRELEQKDYSMMDTSKHIRELIEKYKQSTFKQCFLLMDRYRLECKQRQ